MPLNIRQTDLISMKLEFYLHIYFAVYPSFMAQGPPAQIEKDLRRELMAFKDFLDSAGSYLSKTSEFLQYYALPYVNNPVEHPIFRNVCSKKWATDLRNKLREFLQTNVQKNQSPQLFHWYANFKKKAGLHVAEGHDLARADHTSPEAEEIKERMVMLQKHYLVLEKKEEYAKNTLIESQSKWTMFSKDLLNIANELMNTMDALQVNQSISKIPLQPIQDKLNRYEVFLKNNSDEIHRKHGINMMKPTFIEQYKQQLGTGG